MGLFVMALVSGVCVVSLGLSVAARTIVNAQKIPTPPERIGAWVREASPAVTYEEQRDAPRAVHYLYRQGDKPPLRVSIARADTLNAYRAPYFYLYGSNGRVASKQEAMLPRPGEKLPVYHLQVLSGQSDSAVLVHWTQPAGDDPLLDPLDTPGRIAQSLLTHQPIYVCDVWLPLRADAAYEQVDTLLLELVAPIGRLIKTGK